MPTTSLDLFPSSQYRCHPVYRLYEKRWRFMEASYLGGLAWYNQGTTSRIGPFTLRVSTQTTTPNFRTTSYDETNRLWRHEREKDEPYQRRLRASVYENLLRPFIDMKAATIARACKHLKLPASLEYMERNTDRWGTDAAMARLMRITWAHVDGTIFTHCSKPEGAPQPSRLHELAAGIRTFMELLSPLDLWDWRWNVGLMDFDWALMRERTPEARVSPDEITVPDAQGVVRITGEQSTQSTPTYTRLYKAAPANAHGIREGQGLVIRYADGVEIERKPGPAFVPISVQCATRDPRQSEPIGLDVNGDVADLAELRYNKKSLLTDEEMTHTFTQVAFTGTKDVLDAETDKVMSSHSYLSTSGDVKRIGADVAAATHLMASIDRDAGTMRQMLGIEQRGETSEAAKSGVALQMEAQSMSAKFSGEATCAEVGERAAWRMCYMLEGGSAEQFDAEFELEYHKDFSQLDVAARFSMILMAIEKGGFTGKAKGELQKLLFMATHPEAAQELLDEVFADIDESAETLAIMPPLPFGGTEDPGEAESAGTDEEAPDEGEDAETPPKIDGKGKMPAAFRKGAVMAQIGAK